MTLAKHRADDPEPEPPTSPPPAPPDPEAPGGDPGGSRRGSRKRRRGRHAAFGEVSEKHRPRLGKFELPVVILAAVVLAVLVKSFIVQPFYIPSGSMEDTLQVNDKVIAFKPSYWGSDPSPGDVVVFRDPGRWDVSGEVPDVSRSGASEALHWTLEQVGLAPSSDNDLIKRVIAVGGQTVKCCDGDGNIQVSADGGRTYRSLHEPYVTLGHELAFGAAVTPGMRETGKRAFPPVTVPRGRLFVLGDHRNGSADSLYHYRSDFKGDIVRSTVPVGNVVGKATDIVWPISRWHTLGTPGTFAASALGARGGALALSSSVTLVPYAVRRRRRR